MLKRFKLLFRKPKVGELWSLNQSGMLFTFRVTGYENEEYTFKCLGIEWTGKLCHAGAIYPAKPKPQKLIEALLPLAR